MTESDRRKLVNQIRVMHRWRESFHRAEKSMILQVRAVCRRWTSEGDEAEALARADELYDELDDPQTDLGREMADALAGMLAARDGLASVRKGHEKAMKKAARELPVFAWVESVSGFGELGLAQIVGECGDLSDYATVARLWKRMGLAVMNGERQRRIAGDTPERVALAIEHGYCPRRRSVMFCLGDSMIKKQGPYRDLYLQRKGYEVAAAEAAGLKVAPSAKIPKGRVSEYRSDGHVHRRAKRYMEKRMLRDLWRAWRDTA